MWQLQRVPVRHNPKTRTSIGLVRGLRGVGNVEAMVGAILSKWHTSKLCIHWTRKLRESFALHVKCNTYPCTQEFEQAHSSLPNGLLNLMIIAAPIDKARVSTKFGPLNVSLCDSRQPIGRSSRFRSASHSDLQHTSNLAADTRKRRQKLHSGETGNICVPFLESCLISLILDCLGMADFLWIWFRRLL